MEHLYVFLHVIFSTSTACSCHLARFCSIPAGAASGPWLARMHTPLADGPDPLWVGFSPDANSDWQWYGFFPSLWALRLQYPIANFRSFAALHIASIAKRHSERNRRLISTFLDVSYNNFSRYNSTIIVRGPCATDGLLLVLLHTILRPGRTR